MQDTIPINEALSLTQCTTGLRFGTDAYLLASYVRSRPHGKAVELGAGTGVVSLLCAHHRKFAAITAVEVQPSFIPIIQKNICDNHMENIISPVCANVKEVNTPKETDFVFCNPPYMTVSSGERNTHDEKYLARHEVAGTILDFCLCASRLLKTGGYFTVVWRPDRLTALFDALHTAKLEPKYMTFVHADKIHEPSMILVEAIAGGKVGLHVTPPLFLHPEPASPSTVSSARPLTPEAQSIYDTCSFDAFKSLAN